MSGYGPLHLQTPKQLGEYWANSNEEWKAADHPYALDIARSLWPGSAFGSALGSVHSAAGEGDIPGAVLAGIGAIPARGFLKAMGGVNLSKNAFSPRMISDWGKTGKNALENIGINLANDAYDNYDSLNAYSLVKPQPIAVSFGSPTKTEPSKTRKTFNER